jgi:hypothetical protein
MDSFIIRRIFIARISANGSATAPDFILYFFFFLLVSLLPEQVRGSSSSRFARLVPRNADYFLLADCIAPNGFPARTFSFLPGGSRFAGPSCRLSSFAGPPG